MVKSADKWYRMGREIKPGEQPLKRVAARRKRERSLDSEEEVDPRHEDGAGTGLYAAHQTTLYSAPPVVNGRIPKNVYGNLDLYTPSMVPTGGVHITHPETARAARLLAVDYADAVTGFLFRGRHGTAVTKGAVVANEHQEAVEEVIQAFEDERIRVEEVRRTLEAMRMWKRLLVGLKIRQRIDSYEIEGERDVGIQEKMNRIHDEEDEGGGGFLPDDNPDDYARPSAGGYQVERESHIVERDAGGFVPEDTESEQNDQPMSGSPESRTRDRFIDDFSDEDGGGFLVDDGTADHEDAQRAAQEDDSEDHMELDNDPLAEENMQKGSSPRTSTLSSTRYEDQKQPVKSVGGFLSEGAVQKGSSQGEATLPTSQIDDQSPPVESTGGLLSEEIVRKSPSDRQATLNLSHDEIEESRMLHHFYEYGGTSASTMRNEPLNKPDQRATSPLEDELTVVASQSSESEKGSLLSHDPDDEDADPDWIS
ncbi:xeroderma pigmentosum group C-complementing protein, partial [Lecanoromycetidae sp. Uapishka_2]